MSDQPHHGTFGITRPIRGEVLHKTTALVKRGLDLLNGPKPEDSEIAQLSERANQGDATAQFNLAVAYTRSRERAEKIEAEWYRKAADQGHAYAQFNFGAAYEVGRGVPVDYQQAMHWYRKAADQGVADAQYALGLAYDEGEVLGRDEAQAIYWYRKAADQGLPDAQFALGSSYSSGSESLPQDYRQAIEWYRKAAEQGNTGAQNNLGVAYAYGLGVEQDFVEAHKWVNLAATRDSSDSVSKWHASTRDEFATKMTPKQLSEAQERAQEWLKAFAQHGRSRS